MPAQRVAADASQAATPIPAQDSIRKLYNHSASSPTFTSSLQRYTSNTSEFPATQTTAGVTVVAGPLGRGSTALPHTFRCSTPEGGERPQLHPRVRPSRALRIAPAASAQRIRAKIELCDPPLASKQPKMIGDVEMEFVPSGHGLGFHSDGPLDLVSIEDYERANPYPPSPQKLPRRSTQPIRVASKGEHTSAFCIACQARGITWDFDCFSVAHGCFDIVLKLNGTKIDRIGQYASHKDAKEAICEKHLQTVLATPNLKKRKSIGSTMSSLPGIEDENWINLLMHYTQRHKHPNPEFTETAVHVTLGPFLCTVRFQGSPLTQFGSNIGPCSRKSAAKKAAAREAVQWLRAQGHILQESSKRRKSSSGPNTPDETGLTQSFQDSTNLDEEDEDLSVGEQVHRRALQLGFTQPKFEHTAKEGSFYDTYARFIPADVRKEPRLEGEIAKVFHVFGKKAAQQECGRALLVVFDEIKRSRLAS